MVDTWQPNNSLPSITSDGLKSFLSNEYPLVSPMTPVESLSNEQRQTMAHWLKAHESEWSSVIETLETAEVLYLCALLTVGEQHIGEWQCGKRNPTILAVRHLRKMGKAPEKDFIRWLKKQTDNRYIPYGDALG